MSTVREPVATRAHIRDLKPTQMTVGFREVDWFRKKWRSQSREEGAAYLGRHLIPVILGPKQQHYIIDHHHLCRALLEEGQDDVLITVIAKLSKLDDDQFWVVLDNRGWLHPFDAKGLRRSHADLPGFVADLADDPFRSLAGAVRRAGGFAKDTTPFSEFLWANFFRARFSAKAMARNFSSAVKQALKLSKHKDANYLPGWCGPVDDD